MEIWINVQRFFEYSFLNINIARLLSAVLVFLFSFLLRLVFAKIIIKLLSGLAKKTKMVLGEYFIDTIEKPVRFLITTIGLWLAIKILQLPLNTVLFTSHIIRSMFVISVFWAIYRAERVILPLLQKVWEKTGKEVDEALIPFVTKGLKIVTVIIGITVIVEEWGFDIFGLVTGLGLGGLALALAAKDTAANLFGSITLMMDKPFSAGDWIKTSHVEGTVEEIGFRSTKVRTFSQAIVSIPNSIMSNDPITNWSKMGKRRISFRLGVTYNTSADKMKEFLERLRIMLGNHSEVHPETVIVHFDKFADSALEILIYCYTKTTNWQKYLEVQEEINLKIMDLLSELDISIAFPSRSIYIENKSQ